MGRLLRPLGLDAAEQVKSTGSVYQRLLGQAESALQGAEWFTLHSDRLPAQGSDGADADATMADAAVDSMAEDDAPVPEAAWEVGKGLHATVRFAPCVNATRLSLESGSRSEVLLVARRAAEAGAAWAAALPTAARAALGVTYDIPAGPPARAARPCFAEPNAQSLLGGGRCDCE